MYGAQDDLATGLATSALGLELTRVATAASRTRHGQPPLPVELRAIDAVVHKLRTEVDLLSGRREAAVDDRSSYAMAGFTLDALHAQTAPRPADTSPDAAVDELERIIDRLQRLHDAHVEAADAEFLEELFLASGSGALQALSATGEEAPAQL
ncbi:hypothetical protein [Curtobacterium sp. 20TX0008]|uniref:hypothetical protein n=1 Tax=Curtobacterium sp. 20TX0008 TaxID=3022018 RepID=UPI00232FADB8|nr:hypothetical protein [Curtobacterium sp. 20TX0008]MDB6427093.1 hypothetical protein [Curtobacterium sp. 20TX0008]